MGVTLLIIMIIITVLLCALANQVTSQTNGISPARILAQQKTISENSDLYLTCTTFGFKSQIAVYVYLCKVDHCIDKQKQKQDQIDTTFILPRVGLNQSGNYSCVYSEEDYLLSNVTTRGHNVIQILVISNIHPADISVNGPTVSKGDDVAFRCTVSDVLKTLGECQLIHSYLRRGETILQVQAFNVTQMEVIFIIQSVDMRDSGPYSCVVLPSKCTQEQERNLTGNNKVFLEVKVHPSLVIPVFFGVMTLMMLPVLCLWWIIRRGYLRKPCFLSAVSQQANADVVEEQQAQTEGEDLEAQDGDSFSMEDEEYQNNVVAEDSITYDDCEGVYSIANDEYDDIDLARANRHILTA